MHAVLVSYFILSLLAGLLALFPWPAARIRGYFGGMGGALAALVGLIPVIAVLGGGSPIDMQMSWGLPLGSLHVRLDLLSAWFALPVLFVSALGGIYGMGYMQHYGERSGVGVNWFFYQLLASGMFLVLISFDGVLFLIAWEIMSFAAWFLVMFDHEQGTVQKAGWIYLAATHLGTAFLFALFILFADKTGSLDFSTFAVATGSANILFLLAVVGFGAKAGFFGLHVWLPEAHPAAPSHVSGVMSGVMIKTGIYGLIRVLTLCPVWEDWWGWLLIVIGICSGLGGIIFALVQHDIKRLLAYSSVENIGIICLGLGMGILGMKYQSPIAFLGMAGAMLHVLNHAIFKTTLFMGAGAIVNATGTRQIDLMGGLQKKMPGTALVFLIAAAAICGLPPFNGFVSELLIYLASYHGIIDHASSGAYPAFGGFAVIISLALIGGLAALCFTKVYGVIFLGTARDNRDVHAHEAPRTMLFPMLILALLCLAIGLNGYLLLHIVGPVVTGIHPQGSSMTGANMTALTQAWQTIGSISLVCCGVIALAALIVLIKFLAVRNRTICQEPTWGCAYSRPTAKLQYTGTSFVEPLASAFASLVRTRSKGDVDSSYFPQPESMSTNTPDLFMNGVYLPLFSGCSALFAHLRRIQNGRIHVYILYIILALCGIIVWSFA
ncbi:MAG: proton-conducting transporter membrane subunit [Desulfoplanes sp.]